MGNCDDLDEEKDEENSKKKLKITSFCFNILVVYDVGKIFITILIKYLRQVARQTQYTKCINI